MGSYVKKFDPDNYKILKFYFIALGVLWLALASSVLELDTREMNFFHKYFWARIVVVFIFVYLVNIVDADKDEKLLVSFAVTITYVLLMEV